MKIKILPGAFFAVLIMMLSTCDVASSEVRIINDDAGWCWFQDERAIFVDNKLIAGSVAAGSRDELRKGNIEISSIDLGTGQTTRFVLHKNLELDDHNAPALLTLPDGRILAVYSKHNSDKVIHYRTTVNPGDISEWTPEKTYEFSILDHDVTYANLFQLQGENGRIYNFYRGDDFDPNVLISDDNGATWKHKGRLIGGPGRPYVRYASNNNDTIHFVCTEQHPRDFDNSLYHGYVRNGRIYDSFGEEAGSIGRAPAEHGKLTKIFPGDKDNVAWPSDFEYGADGRLYVVYSVQKDGAGMPKGLGGMDHRYGYAWFDGKQWRHYEVAYAGTKLYGGEDDYTGLITLHPEHPDTIYFSTNAEPRTGKPLISATDSKRHYEIFKGVTADGGQSWEFTQITKNSTQDQIRPNVPENGPNGSALVWLRGRLRTYSDYDLEMVVMSPAP